MCLGSSRFGLLSAVGRIAQNAIQAAVTSFHDVVELVMFEEKGTQVHSDVALEPFLSQKLMMLRCFFRKTAPRTTA